MSTTDTPAKRRAAVRGVFARKSAATFGLHVLLAVLGFTFTLPFRHSAPAITASPVPTTRGTASPVTWA